MASSKSKQKCKSRRNRLERYKSKLGRGKFKGSKILINPKGWDNMSEVLTEFINPFIQYAVTDEAHRKLLSIAIVAWNVSLFPENEQQKMIDESIDVPALSATPEFKKEAKDIVNILIKRKKKYFADYKRIIVDYQLTDKGSDYHLAVASTTDFPSPKQDHLNNSNDSSV